MSTKTTEKHSGKVVFPELSYRLMGIVFDVHNELGGGLRESVYESALCEALKDENLRFKKQLQLPVRYKGKKVGQYYLDLLVENKIVIEIKAGDGFRKSNIDQIYEYLKVTGLRLGILVNFGAKGVKFKRILNVD